MALNDVVEPVGRALELLGVAVIALGSTLAIARYAASHLVGLAHGEAYSAVRRRVGESVLLGLEILVAGDIIRTVAVDPTLASIAVLAGIVGIRTFLSVTIDTEVNGRWPWSRSQPSRAPWNHAGTTPESVT